MRKTSISIFILAFCAWGISENKIFAQNTAAPVSEKAIPLNVSIRDDRFTIENVSFFKRLEKVHATLNINFELHNQTDKDIKLKVVLVAFKNIGSEDKELRRKIKYPVWRKRDLDKEQRKNILLDSIPAIDKNAVDPDIKDSRIYPEFQKYMMYLSKNTSVGNDILLKGINTGVAETLGNVELTYVTQPMKTSAFAKMKVQFNTQNEFFNYFGIILIDPEQNKIVGSDLFYFNGSFRTH
ncbi:MAG: hypothetical protein OEV78_03070 [Spirochaetia bacterium]|nr:hypothetical protein [Spirochaetia bacterium]